MEPTRSVIRQDRARKTTSWTTVPTSTSWTPEANSSVLSTPIPQAIGSRMLCANFWRSQVDEKSHGSFVNLTTTCEHQNGGCEYSRAANVDGLLQSSYLLPQR